MPWKVTQAMNERVKFISAHLARDESIAELCLRFGISRPTAHKWINRYRNGGVENLTERSRAPRSNPKRVEPRMIAAVVAMRKRHPRWGPKKIHALLLCQTADVVVPAVSTIGEILKREGLVKKRRRRLRSSRYARPLGGYDASNSIWCIDFKGHFPVGNDRCHPLTVTDGFSRFIVMCEALHRPLARNVQRALTQAFITYGLPDAIRTDNGPPFSSLAPGGLSHLAVWWARLGIRHERIMPGRPDQNGRHERMHLTLKAETAQPPRSNWRSQRAAFERFVTEYNNERPHEALGQRTPREFYRPSLRSYPKVLPSIEYPEHMETAVAYPNGIISFEGVQWYLTNCLGGQTVGLESCGSDRWKVYFGRQLLGVIDTSAAEERGRRRHAVMVRDDGLVTMTAKKKRRFYGR